MTQFKNETEAFKSIGVQNGVLLFYLKLGKHLVFFKLEFTYVCVDPNPIILCLNRKRKHFVPTLIMVDNLMQFSKSVKLKVLNVLFKDLTKKIVSNYLIKPLFLFVKSIYHLFLVPDSYMNNYAYFFLLSDILELLP